MTKPTVHFIPPATYQTVHDIASGTDATVAHVYALDHPILGQTDVRTSRILNRFEDDSFETLNTIYVPAIYPKAMYG